MAILKIARMGHPVLLGRAAEVEDPTGPEVRQLILDMAETLADAGGIGLAAPQVHRALRLFLWRDGQELRVLMNPEITPLGEERARAWEGCLSIPGLRGEVERPARVAWRGLDHEGRPVQGEAEGIAARVLQHENDHLDGLFYLSRMTDLARLGFIEELARFPEESA
ncbi:peptide deformylase [Roseococcus sp. SDR]|uniref:peptide deformylase n=1 Tax=Roseococcus sp. SDR TaxID=2835532 RepID=UPI001BCEA5A8|nr:peptide deformylase [Roseococcus sp. SDR]MBS7789061.1 peptide deformylase [Roseococcus sp. SDR]MBV1844375.1 peptide deformylase [Roseococcus sp. SDR]